MQRIFHGGCAAQVEREANTILIGQLKRNLAIVNKTAVDIGPSDGQLPLPGGEAIGSVGGFNNGIALQRWRGQNDLAGCARRGQRHSQEQRFLDTIAHHGASISD